MAFGVLGAVGANDIDIDDRAAAGVSFPGFWELLGRLTATPPAA
jgi:5-enolpyruvylshikimate-3-phosphate synthase